MAFVQKVAESRDPVLLDGETGTGKTLLACVIHDLSPRRKGPFHAIGCGRLRPELAASTLFGHEKGAFTGAISSLPGLFETTAQGDLVLNDVDALSSDVQAQLLDYFDDGHVHRLGSTKRVSPDTRVFVTTNRNPEDLVAQGRLRADLYFRLAKHRHTCPPLAMRKDIVELAKILLLNLYDHDFSHRLPICPELSEEALKVIAAHEYWPGNCRMLAAVLGECLWAAHDGIIDAALIQREIDGKSEIFARLARKDGRRTSRKEPYRRTGSPEEEREEMERVLRETRGTVSEAARRMGMSRAWFSSKMREYGFVRDLYLDGGLEGK